MRIYLAGGVSGNLKSYWRLFLAGQSMGIPQGETMRLFLAGQSMGIPQGETMRLFLAGQHGRTDIIKEYKNETISSRKRTPYSSVFERMYNGGGIPKDLKLYILESFYYIDDNFIKLLPYLDDVLIDSGAFTFMISNNNKVDKKINWDEYVEKYAKFINENKIDKFLELDIDSIVGYDEVIRLRNKLEKLTNKKCIPVWHPSRGKEEFINLVKRYSYIALGGLAGTDNSVTYQEYRKIFPWFIKTAHQHNCKIHGLGYTNLKGITKYHFDSVDSTSWTTGNRFGAIYKFNGKTLDKINKPPGTRMKARETAVNNFIEWVKFSNYADKHL